MSTFSASLVCLVVGTVEKILPALPGGEVITHSCSESAPGSPPCSTFPPQGEDAPVTAGSPQGLVSRQPSFHRNIPEACIIHQIMVATPAKTCIITMNQNRKGKHPHRNRGFRCRNSVQTQDSESKKEHNRVCVQMWWNWTRKLPEGCWRPHIILDMTHNSRKN